MKYLKFKKIMNDNTGQNQSIENQIIDKVLESPDRFDGEWRLQSGATAVIQTLTQSGRIKFGNALEKIIEMYFEESGWKSLDKKFVYNKKRYAVDLLLQKNNQVLFVEQKIRDDHDSTKKQGQIANFKNKLQYIKKTYSPKNKIIAIMHFIDPQKQKNKNFYQEELKKINHKYKYLFYGADLFKMAKLESKWKELQKHLRRYKTEYNNCLKMQNIISNFKFNLDYKKIINSSTKHKKNKNTAIKVMRKFIEENNE